MHLEFYTRAGSPGVFATCGPQNTNKCENSHRAHFTPPRQLGFFVLRGARIIDWQAELDTHIVVDVLTLTRIIKPVVTGPAPVTLELRSTTGKNTQPNEMGYTAYITADGIHTFSRNI